MSECFLVQAGKTLWEEDDRFDSLAGSPLCTESSKAAGAIADELCPKGATIVFSPDGQAEKQAADMIAKKSSIRTQADNGLSEIDYGLWQGLTIEEIKRRQPRLRKQWLEAPSGVRPPGGETLLDAQDRVWHAVESIVKKHKNDVPVLVMRPLVLGLLRCRMCDAPLDDIWDYVHDEPVWSRVSIAFEGKRMILKEIVDDGGK